MTERASVISLPGLRVYYMDGSDPDTYNKLLLTEDNNIFVDTGSDFILYLASGREPANNKENQDIDCPVPGCPMA